MLDAIENGYVVFVLLVLINCVSSKLVMRSKKKKMREREGESGNRKIICVIENLIFSLVFHHV